jgi:hypothetical protein
LKAHDYAELIDRLLTSCRYLDCPPHFTSEIKIPENNPCAFEWKDTIHFQDGLRLEVTDYAIFAPDGGMIERNFMYDFREEETGRLVWRICNHGTWKMVDEPCHVHADPDDEGNRLEIWPSSDETTFAYVMNCLKKHYEKKPQEWEAVAP